MEQKLLAYVSRRTAWILLALCVGFWLVSAFGLLQLPSETPPAAMFLWMYFHLLTALASPLVAAAAIAVLILHRSRSAADPELPGGVPDEA